MSTSGNDPRDPRSEGEDAAFEAAWHEIVARFDERPASTVVPVVPEASEADAEQTAPAADPEPFGEQIEEPRPLSAGEAATDDPLRHELDASLEEQYGEQFDAQLAPDLDDPELAQPDPLPAWSPGEVLDAEDRSTYVPPTPPLPRATPERWLAWIALLGIPVVVVLCTVLSWTPAEIVRWFLGAAWLGAFAYLVVTMDNEPRDPWDDGSRV